MSYRLACLAFVVGAVSAAQASVVIVSAEYIVSADAQAGSMALSDLSADTVTASSGSYSANIYVDEIVPAGQSAYAQSSASAQWSSTSGTSIVGKTHGTAWANDLGIGASASARSRLVLYFDVPYDTTGTFDFEGVSSSVERLVGGSWEAFADADWSGSLSASSYRWVLDKSYAVSGSGSHDGFADFTADVQAVPEPGTLLALGVGAALAARRRRRA
ncbi:MAG: PEP-CTERM sorting domain-containing protein [Fimbriimonas sp.]